MNESKNSEPPDGGGPSQENSSYVLQLMDTDDIGVVIKRVPNQNINSTPASFQGQISEHVIPHSNASALSGNSGLSTSGEHMPQHTSPTSENQPKYSNKYEMNDCGPFLVILESINQNIGKLHPMSIGKLLLQQHKELDNFIQSITFAGRNRIKVIMKSAYHANMLLNSKILEQKEIKSFIPQYLTKRVGIVRGVELSLSDDEIKSLISPLSGQIFTVVEAMRMKRRVIIEGKEPEYIPTGTVKLTFKGQRLPECISLCKVICNVEPYIQRVVQCYKCLRYGHVSVQCKSKDRCAKCANEHITSECPSTNAPSCIFCKGSHLSSDHKVCPEYLKQKNIKNIMAQENISYRDDSSKINNSFSSVLQSPIKCTPEDFPSLFENRKRKKPATVINSLYTAQNIHQDHSGNGVCLLSNSTSDSINNSIPTVIEKLVNATMQMHRVKNLSQAQCETTIKKIVQSLLVSNSINKL